MPGPLDELREITAAVGVPVQAVGGLTTEQAMRTPEYGAPLVVLGAPLVIDADKFRTAVESMSKAGDPGNDSENSLESKLRLICERIHAYGDVGPQLKRG